MNSELIVKLENLLEKYEGELKVYQDEYNELTDLTHVPSKKDLARMKQIRKEVSTLATDIKEMREDVNSLKEIDKTICDLTAVIQKNDGVTTKFAKEMKEQLLEEEKALEEAITNKWSGLEPEKEETKEEETTEEKKVQAKPTSKKKLITIAALCAAIGILTGVVIGKGTSKKVKNVDSNVAITEVDENKEEIAVLDEATINSMMNTVVSSLNANFEKHDYTADEIVNMINWINGGVVNEASVDEGVSVHDRFDQIVSRENQREVKSEIDLSNLFLKNTRGQKLAKEVYNIRVKYLNAKTNEEKTKVAEEFTRLFVNSFVIPGNEGVTNSWALETTGMEAFMDSYFMGTYALIDAENVKVNINGSEFNLDKVAESINDMECETEDLDGNKVTTNKLSSDLLGMIREAIYIKENNSSLTLTK